MRKEVLIIFLFLTSCISSAKTDIVLRGELKEIYSRQSQPYKKILVRWINYPYKDFHKFNYLEKNADDIKPVEVDEKSYLKFKSKIINEFKESGLYDEENGSGTVKILLTTYGRWTIKELLSTYLVDTAYIFLLPSSLEVNYIMKVKAEKEDKTINFEKQGQVKTTFFFLFLPVSIFSSFGGSEKTVLNNLIYQTIAELKKY
jgi:hypothetical protein